MSQTVRFGHQGNDHLTLRDSGVLFGFGGDDTLVAEGNSAAYYQAFMLGGRGNDRYIFDGAAAVIADTGGHDSLRLPGSQYDYVGAFVEGRDLLLVNQWTGQEVFILDAGGRGKIETFHSEYGDTLGFDEVARQIYSDGLGNVSYAELEAVSAGQFNAHQFAMAREINLAWADMDWDSVWQQVADRGAGPGAVAETLNARLESGLSPAARAEWHRQQGPETLKQASFEGVEQHLPETPEGDAGSPGLIPRETVAKIALLYEAALDRVPDIDGLNYWAEASQALSFDDISARFIDSDEFRHSVDASSDDAFVNQLYLNVLDRPADASGEAYWLGQIADGMAQSEVLSRFADSDENRADADWLAGLEQTDDGWVIA